MRNKLEFIFNYYGEQVQVEKVKEELRELIEAIENNDTENIIEEIADVEIMLEQLKMFKFFDENKYKEIKEFKINRQIKRIEMSNNYE